MSSLDESSAVDNNQLAFGILEKELGIPPVMSASDLANSGQIDKLSIVLYLSQIQKAFSAAAKPGNLGMSNLRPDNPIWMHIYFNRVVHPVHTQEDFWVLCYIIVFFYWL